MADATGRRGGHRISGRASPRSRRHHDRRTTLLWILAAGFLLLTVIGFVAVIVNGNTAGNSIASGLIGVAFLLAVAVALGAAARRRGRLTATTSAASATWPPSAPSTWGTQNLLGARRRGGWSGSTGRPGAGLRRWARNPRTSLAILLACFLAAAVAAIVDFRDAQRSSYTQHHGIRVTGLIGTQDNAVHCGRNGCSHTFSAPVALVTPVDGYLSTTLHGQGSLTGGSTATILVDPREPTYAELPGDKLHAAGSWVGYAIGAAFFLLLLLLVGYRYLRIRFGPPPGSLRADPPPSDSPPVNPGPTGTGPQTA